MSVFSLPQESTVLLPSSKIEYLAALLRNPYLLNMQNELQSRDFQRGEEPERNDKKNEKKGSSKNRRRHKDMSQFRGRFG